MTVGDGDGEGEGEGRGGWGGRWRQHGTGQMRGPRADLGLEAWCGVRAVRGHASEWVGGQENGGADDCARVICTRPRWDNVAEAACRGTRWTHCTRRTSARNDRALGPHRGRPAG